MDVEIACTLSEAEFRIRETEVIKKLKGKAIEIAPVLNGYTYLFSSSAEVLKDIFAFVQLEHKCCKFLDLIVKVSSNETSLTISGPETARQFIDETFGSYVRPN